MSGTHSIPPFVDLLANVDAAGALTLLALVQGAAIALLVLRLVLRRSADEGPRGAARRASDGAENRGLADVQGLGREIRGDLESARGDLSDLEVKVSAYERAAGDLFFAAHDRQRESEDRVGRLVSEVIVSLDLCEPRAPGRARDSGDEDRALSAVSRRLRRSLESAGIREIAVRAGDPFSSEIHQRMDARESSMPAGSVLEVLRRGYADASRPEAPVLCRPAGVAVSLGPAPEGTGSAAGVESPAELPAESPAESPAEPAVGASIQASADERED